MNKIDLDWWEVFRSQKNNYITDEEYRRISEMHSNYLEHTLQYPCKCNPDVIQSYIHDLNTIYENRQS